MRPVWLLSVAVIAAVPRAVFPQGTPQGPEFRANTFTTGSQSTPGLATNIAGDFTVAWESPQDGSGTGIFAQRFAAGVPIGPEFRVNTFTTGNQFASAVASDITGNVMVVWTSELQDGSGLGIFGQTFSSNGVPSSAEFRVSSYGTGDQFGPAAAGDKSGAILVVWTSDGQDGSGQGVFAQRFAPFGTPLGPEFRLNTATAGNQVSPSVASMQSGTFVVAWESEGQDGAGLGVFGQRYSASGNPIGPEFRVNTFTTGTQRAPAVGAAFGSFVVVWQGDGHEGPGYGVFGQRFANSGAAAGPEFLVNSFVTGAQSGPTVADDVNGDFVVVWASPDQDGDAAGIFGQRYLVSGAPLGSEFRVNTYTTAAQSRPAVAVSFAGNFAVVWASDTQDGAAYGVFGQRYTQIVPVELEAFRVE
jgi:hypothetical protein